MLHLDTHVVVWLHGGELDNIPKPIAARIEAEDLVVSPMVILEVDFLREIGRVTQGGREVVDALARSIGLAVSETDFRTVTDAATALRWTRDPFDRLIVANALVDGATLVTRDRNIRRHCRSAVWTGATRTA